jgi:hypothetical protein
VGDPIISTAAAIVLMSSSTAHSLTQETINLGFRWFTALSTGDPQAWMGAGAVGGVVGFVIKFWWKLVKLVPWLFRGIVVGKAKGFVSDIEKNLPNPNDDPMINEQRYQMFKIKVRELLTLADSIVSRIPLLSKIAFIIPWFHNMPDAEFDMFCRPLATYALSLTVTARKGIEAGPTK